MPNTLAHIACNGFISKPLFKDSDLIWILTGCLLPDIPWINQRIAGFLFTEINGYDLKTYSIAQATLLLSLVLSAALSALSYNYKRVFSILSIGTLLHLLLDSLQTKWANGVHLFAPFNWEYINLNLFWPENIVTYILSFFGILFYLVNIKKVRNSTADITFNLKRLNIFLILILFYFLIPFTLLDQINNADVHYISTLRKTNERTGKYVELDRKKIYYDENTNSTWIEAYNNDLIELEGIGNLDCTKLSVRGVFIGNDLLKVIEYHENWAIVRDGTSYIGILLIVASWILVLRKEIIGKTGFKKN